VFEEHEHGVAVHVMGEIVSGKGFEFDHLYVESQIELPVGLSTLFVSALWLPGLLLRGFLTCASRFRALFCSGDR
jgi:hypothetical protein